MLVKMSEKSSTKADFRGENQKDMSQDMERWGLTAHILHAGGPWKLESHFRSYSDTTQANTAPGGRFRCLSRSALFETQGSTA